MDVIELFEVIRGRLREYDIKMEATNFGPANHDLSQSPDASVYLSRGAHRASYRAILKSKPNVTELLHQAQWHDAGRMLLLTPYLNPRTAKTLQRAGVQYIDGAGNTMLQFDDVYVRVEGRRAASRSQDLQGHSTKETSNLFSPRRAQVSMALISWPELANASVRSIAECAGTSVGIAQSTTMLLRRMALEPSRSQRDRDRLIDMWVSAYPEGLSRTLEIDSFEGDPNALGVDQADTNLWVSGEALASGLSGQQTLSLYTEHLSSRLVATNRWRRSPSPNIFVRRKFWRAPRETADASLLGPPPAPPLIVYSDMMAIDDPRIRIAAAEYRERHGGLADAHHR